MRTLSKGFWSFFIKESLISKSLLGAFGLFIAAQINIPIKPVPITFHTVFICLIGLLYSPREAFFSVAAYLAAGAVGFPVFSGFSSGINILTGSNMGYFLGFLLSAPAISFAYKKIGGKTFGILVSCSIGHFIIYLLGCSWLAISIGVKAALYGGFLVFLPSGIAKIIIFSYLFYFIKGKIKSI